MTTRTGCVLASIALASLAAACGRSAGRGVALSVQGWATSDGAAPLARACALDLSTLAGTATTMPPNVGVLTVRLGSASTAGDAPFTARIRVKLRTGQTGMGRALRYYDATLHGVGRYVPPSESSTPRPIPLPVPGGWLLSNVTVERCAYRPFGLMPFLEDLWGET